MKKATLEYQIKKDMSNLSEFTNRLDSAAESIKKYDYEISSRFVAFEGSPFFLVYIKSKNGNYEALRDYIDIAGIPSLVRLGSDYGYVEEALKPLGKKLKSVAFGLMGKRVVDI